MREIVMALIAGVTVITHEDVTRPQILELYPDSLTATASARDLNHVVCNLLGVALEILAMVGYYLLAGAVEGAGKVSVCHVI
ncbi:glycoside hydrolase [Aeromonas phage 13AhydR10PP]|nr:glycoside hydrolase [Aeromonas phage 13AhydR10PP]